MLHTNGLQQPAEVNFGCDAVHAQPGTCGDRFALVGNPAADSARLESRGCRPLASLEWGGADAALSCCELSLYSQAT